MLAIRCCQVVILLLYCGIFNCFFPKLVDYFQRWIIKSCWCRGCPVFSSLYFENSCSAFLYQLRYVVYLICSSRVCLQITSATSSQMPVLAPQSPHRSTCSYQEQTLPPSGGKIRCLEHAKTIISHASLGMRCNRLRNFQCFFHHCLLTRPVFWSILTAYQVVD